MQVSISSQCASALDNLAGFYFKHYVAAEEGPSSAGQVPPQNGYNTFPSFLFPLFLKDWQRIQSLLIA